MMCILYIGYAYCGIGHPDDEDFDGEYLWCYDDENIINWNGLTGAVFRWPVIDNSIHWHSDRVLGQYLKVQYERP